MLTSKEALKALARQGAFLPQEEMLEIKRSKKQLFIGIPKENSFQEHRVALVPSAVKLLVNNGHRIVVETNAGKRSNFSDNEYSEAGAEIAYDVTQVYQCDMILKVAPPSHEEIDTMFKDQIVFSALQLPVQPKDTLQRLMNKGVSAVAWDYIKDEDDIFPIVRAMGEIAGNTAILVAAEYLSNINIGNGTMFGGISGVAPSEVVILGAGTVGEFAARAAIGLGASVKIFDNSIFKLRRLQNDLGMRLFTSIINPDELERALKTADVAIGAMRAPYGRTPCIVTEEMVGQMKEGAVIVDVSIDQGGCFETSQITSHTSPIVVKNGVVHYGVPNIASRVSRTASHALSNIFAPIILAMGEEGGFTNYVKKDCGFRNGVYFYRGTLTNENLGRAFNLPFKPNDLLFSAM
jgi:alanine dehydrogenase